MSYLAKLAVDSDGGPNIDHDPYWQAETSLKLNGKSINAQKVPYTVIPIGISNMIPPIVLGSKVICTNTKNGKVVEGVVADLGPRTKVGEASCEMARRLGLSGNSNHGGTSDHIIHYEIYVGVPAVVDGVCYQLQPLHG